MSEPKEPDLKETLRREALRHRMRIDPASEDPEEAVAYFFESIKPRADQVVAAYWPKDNEFDTRPLLERLLREGHTCALAVVQKNTRELSFARWSAGTKIEKASIGMFQPVIDEKTQWLEPDIVIVPLLAFDRRGYRLGYGGGYYDATLKSLRVKKNIVAVGVAYAQQAVLFNLPAEDHDERLDWVITPQGTHYFV